MHEVHPSRLISGTFLGIDHFSDEEATRFQADIRSLDEAQWVRMIDDMHAIGIDTLIFQQCATRREGGDKATAYYPSPTRPRMRWQKGDTSPRTCAGKSSTADDGVAEEE